MYLNDMIIKKITTKNDGDIYNQLDKILGYGKDEKVYEFKQLYQYDDSTAFAIFDLDLSRICVEFSFIGEPNEDSELINGETMIMGFEEIKLLRELGKVSFYSTMFNIEDVILDIEPDRGFTRKVKIFVSAFIEDSEN